jgi:hypothetical protein
MDIPTEKVQFLGNFAYTLPLIGFQQVPGRDTTKAYCDSGRQSGFALLYVGISPAPRGTENENRAQRVTLARTRLPIFLRLAGRSPTIVRSAGPLFSRRPAIVRI